MAKDRTPEDRTAAGKKGAETNRANAAARKEAIAKLDRQEKKGT